MDVTLPDGTVINGVPEGTTKAQLAQKLTANGMNVPKDWMATPQPAQPVQPAAPVETSPLLKQLHATDRPLDIGEGANQLGQGVTDIATKLGASPEVAAGAGTVANVGVQALPMLAGGEAAKVAKPAFEWASEGLMRGALKPTLSAAKKGKDVTAVKTMLEKNIPLTQSGMDVIKLNVSDLNSLVKDAIANSKKTIQIADIEKAFGESMKKFEGMPKSDVDSIKREWNDFITHDFVRGKTEISIQDAQKLKQGFQKSVAEKFGQEGTGSQEAQKSIARALRVEVGEKAPEVIPWNAEEKKLLDTLTVAQRRVIQDSNKNPLGLAAFAVRHPIEFSAAMADRSATFRAFMARILHKGQTSIPASTGRVIGAGIGSAEAERARRKSERAGNASPNS